MKALKVLAFSLIAASAVNAADLPRKGTMPAAIMSPAPMASWTGFYAGAHAGWGWSSGTPNLAGYIAGFQAGYDHQFGSIVAGLAADYSFANVRGGVPALGSVINGNQGSLRARLGYAFSPSFLGYVTGGYGFGGLKVVNYIIPSTTSVNLTGAVLGIGGEYKFDRNMSAFAEYRAFGSKATSVSTAGTINSLRVGVNYRF